MSAEALLESTWLDEGCGCKQQRLPLAFVRMRAGSLSATGLDLVQQKRAARQQEQASASLGNKAPARRVR